MKERGGGSGGNGWLALVALCLAVAYCGYGSPSSPPAEATPPIAAALTSDGSEKPDGDHVSDVGGDEEVKGGETYEQYDARRDTLQTGLYSGGDECTEDCGGHDAGRDWAERRGISSPDDCGGNSWSFEEGCRSYAEEQQREGDEGEQDEGEN